MDLKIMNKGKDYLIDQLRKEREVFAEERQGYVEKLTRFNHRVGELETKLLQLGAPLEKLRHADLEGERKDFDA